MCEAPCNKCSSKSTCINCISDHSFDDGYCEGKCDRGEYKGDFIDFIITIKKCTDCLSGCEVCTSDSNCFKCYSPYFLMDGNSCKDKCPSGYFKNGKRECEVCDGKCKSCTSKRKC